MGPAIFEHIMQYLNKCLVLALYEHFSHAENKHSISKYRNIRYTCKCRKQVELIKKYSVKVQRIQETQEDKGVHRGTQENNTLLCLTVFSGHRITQYCFIPKKKQIKNPDPTPSPKVCGLEHKSKLDVLLNLCYKLLH